jgi:hypothetical protein
MDHWTAQRLLERVSYDGVWAVGPDRRPKSRVSHDEARITKTARRRVRHGAARAQARAAVGART